MSRASEAVRARRLYRSHHWGLPPQRAIDLGPNRVYPEHLPQMGELTRVALQGLDDSGRAAGRVEAYALPRGVHLSFGLDRPRRLYVVLERPALGRAVARALPEPLGPGEPLQDLNDRIVGRWNRRLYDRPAARRLRVWPLGVLRTVWYECEKGDDGPSTYRHHLGEESGKPPMLAIDDAGRLWIAGGNYKVEPRGIVD